MAVEVGVEICLFASGVLEVVVVEVVFGLCFIGFVVHPKAVPSQLSGVTV